MMHLLRRASIGRGPGYAAALAATCVVLLAPAGASAFCRTTTVPIPASYSPSRGCFTSGLPLWWKNACVGYSLNKAGSKSTPLAEATRVFDAAFQTWSTITCADTAQPVGISAQNLGPVDCGEVRYNSTGPNQNLIVFRDDAWPYSDPNNTLGLTTVTFNADNGEIYDADMEINATAGNLSTDDLVPANGFDLLSVVTHEAGHFFGIAHATDTRSTMFASYKPGSSAQRTLADDDKAGLCAIYPDATTRAVATSVDPRGFTAAGPCDPAPRHGFGAGCEANPPPADAADGGCSTSPRSAGAAGAGTRAGLGALALGAVAMLAARARRARRVRRAG